MWKAKWHLGTAFVYGRQREIRWKEIICLWRVLGMRSAGQGDRRLRRGIQGEVHPGDLGGGVDGVADGGIVQRRFRRRTGSATDATGLGGVPGVDGQPDPADQSAQWVTMSLLRLLQFRLEACGEVGWRFRLPWTKEGSSQRAGRGAADAAASRANSHRFPRSGPRTEGILKGDAA